MYVHNDFLHIYAGSSYTKELKSSTWDSTLVVSDFEIYETTPKFIQSPTLSFFISGSKLMFGGYYQTNDSLFVDYYSFSSTIYETKDLYFLATTSPQTIVWARSKSSKYWINLEIPEPNPILAISSSNESLYLFSETKSWLADIKSIKEFIEIKENALNECLIFTSFNQKGFECSPMNFKSSPSNLESPVFCEGSQCETTSFPSIN